ncbi:uncharacterized protein LACBIDRAFT_323404 [Laccaria bicolor S238N-H82]|uniref:Predicted protein n=1 Tax=Laccaria bicolor (strain S238N-H82 / ATCC MYA-4686) TaxID=486041 RepID=B0CXI0_LACBS|nr:uncharacterized protein LACBIDRAFT_323404 [Laccaria bicolor S238N-H82]EDR12727.1 predicted protein [Laccaria bicolor S238N-H82]|eukprot:XP_001876991.1 predicted protein [Laccaria bicolor S238N-H82]
MAEAQASSGGERKNIYHIYLSCEDPDVGIGTCQQEASDPPIQYIESHSTYHTQRNQFSFDTSSSKSIDTGLKKLSKKFDLSFQFGTAPHDFTISHTPKDGLLTRYWQINSLLSLFIENAIPIALAINNTRTSIPNIMITNSGSQSFDIYAGPFTKNDQLTVSPFADVFLYTTDIPASIAKQVLPTLNKAGSNQRHELEEREQEMSS